jgi:hypothetical protein
MVGLIRSSQFAAAWTDTCCEVVVARAVVARVVIADREVWAAPVGGDCCATNTTVQDLLTVFAPGAV